MSRGAEYADYVVEGSDDEQAQQQSVGLDFDQVRRQRAELSRPQQKPTEPSGPQSDLGRAVWNILFNPERPNRAQPDFEKNLASVVKRAQNMPIGESLPGSVSFFKKHRYVFTADSELPVVVMKSNEELERERERTKHLVPVMCDRDMIRAIGESLKKKSKKSKKSKPIIEEDEDMFGGFVGSSSSGPALEMPEGVPLFEQERIGETEDADLIRRTLIESRAGLPSSDKKTGHVQEDDEFQASRSFGAKLDLSKFASADEETKKRKNKDNEIFQKVMKKLDHR